MPSGSSASLAHPRPPAHSKTRSTRLVADGHSSSGVRRDSIQDASCLDALISVGPPSRQVRDDPEAAGGALHSPHCASVLRQRHTIREVANLRAPGVGLPAERTDGHELFLASRPAARVCEENLPPGVKQPQLGKGEIPVKFGRPRPGVRLWMEYSPRRTRRLSSRREASPRMRPSPGSTVTGGACPADRRRTCPVSPPT